MCHRGVAQCSVCVYSLSSEIIASLHSLQYVNAMPLLIQARIPSEDLAKLQSQHPVASCAAWPEDGREGS
jgi:hypothetical protein